MKFVFKILARNFQKIPLGKLVLYFTLDSDGIRLNVQSWKPQNLTVCISSIHCLSCPEVLSFPICYEPLWEPARLSPAVQETTNCHKLWVMHLTQCSCSLILVRSWSLSLGEYLILYHAATKESWSAEVDRKDQSLLKLNIDRNSANITKHSSPTLLIGNNSLGFDRFFCCSTLSWIIFSSILIWNLQAFCCTTIIYETNSLNFPHLSLNYWLLVCLAFCLTWCKINWNCLIFLRFAYVISRSWHCFSSPHCLE